MSWNQMSGIEFGITSLGIKCPELSLESQVLESNVRFWDRKHLSWNQVSWNQVSGIDFGITRLGIRCPDLG